MIFEKKLKNVTYRFNDFNKFLFIERMNESTAVTLSKSESGSLLRFIFSMIQFHSHPKKNKKSKVLENKI